MKSGFRLISAVATATVLAIMPAVSTTVRADQPASGGKQNLPPLALDSGGPDAYGYYYVDSNDNAFNAPSYEWIDIEVNGADMGITGDDDNEGPFPIGFVFNYYGTDFNQFYACSNGFASFTSTNDDYFNEMIPTADEPNNLLAVFWDDLHPQGTGHAYYWSNNVDSCVIAWYDFQRYSGDGMYTFEIILTADGNITYQYNSLSGILDSHTIGIENGDGTIGLQYIYNESRDESNTAIQFSMAPPDYGRQYNIMVVAADNVSDYMDAMQLNSDIGDIGYFDARTQNPTMADFEGYDVVVVWSNFAFADPSGLGDMLADYIDEGGRVVLQQFCFGSGWNLGGRIMSDYSPFSIGNVSYTSKDLGSYEAGHPLMKDVNSLTDQFSSVVSLQNDAMLVASYSDGTPMVAYNPDNYLVAINCYTGNTSQYSGDLMQLCHNAAVFAAKGPSNILLIDGGTGADMADHDLTMFPDIDVVNHYNGRLSTPSLSFLQMYDVVVVWSDYSFADPQSLGNRLADYVDSGGGALLMEFCFNNSTSLQGRMMNSYSPFGTGSVPYVFKSLGQYDNNNPLMAGVTDVIDYFSANVAMENGGVQVASWDDDTPFVAYNPNHNVVAVNGFIGDPQQFTGDMMMIVHNAVNYLMGTTAVDDNSIELPGQFSLAQNYPNPFNPTTKISFELPSNSNVALYVFDILGRKVATLEDGMMEAGQHSVEFDASRYGSGVYFYRLDAGDFTQTRKMMVLK